MSMKPSKNEPNAYRLPMFRLPQGLWARCLAGSSLLGVAVLVIVFLSPVNPFEAETVEEVPERLAKLIVAKPKPPAPPAVKAVEVAQPEAPEPEPEKKIDEPKPELKPEARPPKKTRREKPKPKDPDAGKAGRERAKKVTETLTQTTAAVEKSISSLNDALASTSGDPRPAAKRSRRSRKVRGGRSGAQVASVGVADVTTGYGADGGGSIEGDLVAIESISAPPGATDGAAGDGETAAPGVYRSNASLMAVVRRYAPGIRFCYENELKRSPTLEGKLVFTITVSAGGSVTDVRVAEDSLGSGDVVSCALSQIREWAFPPIDGGDTSFRAPFVFTPPGP